MPETLISSRRTTGNKAERKARLTADLVNEMSWLLSQPPTCIGAKIRPEEELANELGLTRRQVREAITLFTDKGILARRQGSGTYVRRIHSRPADAVESKTFGLTHELLFLDLQSSSLQNLQHQGHINHPSRSLRIGLWTDWQLSPPHSTTYFILMMFMHQAQQAGHTMTIHAQTVQSRISLSVKAMAEQIEHSTDDGFLVGMLYAPIFLEARKLAQSDCPYLFHATGTKNTYQHPSIYLNTSKAIETVLLNFVEQGYQRIGLIAMNKGAEYDSEHHTYQAVMNRSNLCNEFCTYSRDMGVASAMTATRELLAKADGKLDAIYVANDMVLVGVLEVLNMQGLVPGKDIAIITLSNHGYPLPAAYDWSVMEFSPQSYASITIRQLCHQIEHPDTPSVSMGIEATWKPGNTHLHTPKIS